MKSVTECLTNLSSTDDEHGRLKGYIKGLEHRMKACKAVEFMKAEGKNNVEKESKALNSDEYVKMVDEYENACIDFHTIDARRTTWELHVAVYQTQSANKRQGNV